ncbi:MAG: metallophosphoesterase [Oscillospiraceae bacterium]|nr:metallophosphoesterase [Oscillospiraceae bacterium]
MKIFACSDFHGARVIMDKLPLIAGDVDLILLCGDICGKKIGEPTDDLPKFQRENIEYVCSILDRTGTPYRYIYGNDDHIETNLGNRLTEPEDICGYTFCPIERVLPTGKNTNRETSEQCIADTLSSFPTGDRIIIVAHTPPYGVCDNANSGKHCGSTAARRWIEESSPLAWFCGHIHEDFSTAVIGSTRVFNCAVWLWEANLRGWIFDTETGEYRRVWL